ncbi:hypothetical protein V8C37DRAFT_394119 [Trichoderma ceciliae]
MSSQHPPYGQQGPNAGQYMYPQGVPGPAPVPPAGPQTPSYYGYGPAPTGSPYQGQPYPGGQYQHPPSGAPAQRYPGQPGTGYGAPPPAQSIAYGQQYSHQCGQQPPYPPQPYGVAPPVQQWQQQQPHQSGYVSAPGEQPYAYNVPPTPASPGYDTAQSLSIPRVDTAADVEVLRKAMKGMGCDERALIRVFANRKYQHPWALRQLRNDYDSRFVRELEKDVKDETRGGFENALVALLRGPLDHDVYTLDKALDRAGTDEEALMDVLLCRSNADIRAIAAEYRHTKGRDLLAAIKDDVDDTLFRLYSMVLSATRAEDAAPVMPADIDHKITELQRATEGVIGANAVAVAQIFTSASNAQLRAMSDAYRQKYHRSLQDVIEKEFRGDMEDALLRMLVFATADGGKTDADGLRAPLMKTMKRDKTFIYRALRLYWGDGRRLQAAQAAHQKFYGKALGKQLKELLSGDYEELMVALIGEK